MKELTAEETRVLGVLVEKSLTTPELYPLTMKALIGGCNQKSNRFPVVSYDAATVTQAVEGLCAKTFAIGSDIPGSRVRKYSHFFTDRFKFVPGEVAILCELLLRGPQTLGELRVRAGRMHLFEDVAAVEQYVRDLLDVSPPWMVVLPLQPGKKEQRYMHTLMGTNMEEIVLEQTLPAGRGSSALQERVAQLEQEVTEQRRMLATLQEAFQGFKAQFE